MGRHGLPDKEYIWTPELAYIVGLLATDGNLSGDGRHISLTSNDIQLLNTFKECLGIENTIGVIRNTLSKRNGHRVQFGNVQLYRWLSSIGLTPRKTYTIGAINVPLEFIPNFVRGHLDGDGTITTYTDRYNTRKNPKYVYERLWVRFLSASKEHVEWLQAQIKKTCKVDGRIHEIKHGTLGTVPMHTLKFGKKESIVLLKAIYYKAGLPCLKRKYEIAKTWIK